MKNMSHHKLRVEKNCLNCGATVAGRFCPDCGQENTINRPSFPYLFKHFFEDLLHYDSGFWKTMKALFFRPGKMVLAYLAGKRKTYVPPVKLYIFISFVTFFIPFVLPDLQSDATGSKQGALDGITVAGVKNIRTVAQLDSLQLVLPEGRKLSPAAYDRLKETLPLAAAGVRQGESHSTDASDYPEPMEEERGHLIGFADDGMNIGKYQHVKTGAQLDSIDQTLPEADRMNWASKAIIRKLLEIRQRDFEEGENVAAEFTEAFVHNLPKALFVYLPFFAFFLWLFHSKKRWLYYDHGIFTLYYFSFLLLLFTFNVLFHWLLSIPRAYFPRLDHAGHLLQILVYLFSAGYACFYFFRAHHRVYDERRWMSRTKSVVLFWVNAIFLVLTLTVYTLLTVLFV